MSTDRLRRRREDLFQSIAGRPGGAAKLLLSERILLEATAGLEDLRPIALGEISSAIAEIRTLADHQDRIKDIFAAAHDVRGLAGSYGLAGVGVVAGAIRTYGENRPVDFSPDWVLIQLLSQMLARAFDHPGEASIETLQINCRQAVTKAMAREGRDPPEGAF